MSLYCNEKWDGLFGVPWRMLRSQSIKLWGAVGESPYFRNFQKYEACFSEDGVTLLLWNLDNNTYCRYSIISLTPGVLSCWWLMAEKHLKGSSLLNASGNPCYFYFGALSISEVQKNNIFGFSAIFFSLEKLPEYRTVGVGSRERLGGFKGFRLRVAGFWTDFQTGLTCFGIGALL